jgi:hypothetical protein
VHPTVRPPNPLDLPRPAADKNIADIKDALTNNPIADAFEKHHDAYSDYLHVGRPAPRTPRRCPAPRTPRRSSPTPPLGGPESAL